MAAFLKPVDQANSNTRNENWKATAFLNLYLPTQDGGKRKIGFIALKNSKATDKQLIDHLQADEGNITKLLEKLVIEFNMADAADANGLALD